MLVARPMMFPVSRVMGLTNERLSSEVVTTLPGGRPVHIAEASGASAKSAQVPAQTIPKGSSSQRVIGIEKVVFPNPASVALNPVRRQIGGPGNSPRT
jgi:hypothetical protein